MAVGADQKLGYLVGKAFAYVSHQRPAGERLQPFITPAHAPPFATGKNQPCQVVRRYHGASWYLSKNVEYGDDGAGAPRLSSQFVDRLVNMR
jgi:hypothetical protein